MTKPIASSQATARAAIASHRFGLGEASLQAAMTDPRGWLEAQIGPADVHRPAAGETLADVSTALRHQAALIDERRRRRAAANTNPSAMVSEADEKAFIEPLRLLAQSDIRARLGTAALSSKPFAERLALFWANHFTVSAAKNTVRGLVGPFEREAIRPHIAGRFEDLLRASVMHPAMLRYLDNDRSAGPHSRVVQQRARRAREQGDEGPRITGLNENLAREVLELHTLGAASARAGVYTQADVTAFAAVLTGWRVPNEAFMRDEGRDSPTRFEAAWHEPGPKTVLGKRVPEGAEGLKRVLAELARHPATASFIATKLARHFVADDPPPSLVERLTQAYMRSEGDLPTVYRALIDAPEPWHDTPAKLKSPEELVIATARLLNLGARAFERLADGGVILLGQRIQAAPSPAGWPDTATEWLGPEAVWKRVEWATRLADRVGRNIDARALASAALGTTLSENTARQIERAADGSQALALLILSPEFQRR